MKKGLTNDRPAASSGVFYTFRTEFDAGLNGILPRHLHSFYNDCVLVLALKKYWITHSPVLTGAVELVDVPGWKMPLTGCAVF